MAKNREKKVRLGVALGSGSARGWAHIGVLRALSEMGIEPDIVAGSSIGALVGGAYASDQLADLERWCRSLSRKEIVGYLDVGFLGGGLIQGERLAKLVRNKIGDHEIESLPKAFAAVATDLETGQEVWFREGPILSSVRASMAIPGLFSPVHLKGQWLVDGGLTNPVPVSLCRAMGAEVVIAVNLNSDIVGKHSRNKTEKRPKAPDTDPGGLEFFGSVLTSFKLGLYENKKSLLSKLLGENIESPGVFEVMASAINIMQDRITRARMAGDPPDITLSPRLSKIGLLEFDKAGQAIEEGMECAKSMRSRIEDVVG